MSLSDQHRLHQFNERGPDQLPLTPSATPFGGRSIPSHCFCPTCGALCADREEFRSHFVACVAQNGNPSGVYLRDELRSAGPPSERTKKRNDRLSAVTSERTKKRNDRLSAVPSERTKKRNDRLSAVPSERTQKRNDRLSAVNGVVIPSKLAAGQLPYTGPYQPGDSATLNLSCPLCKGPFGRADHVKSHFPACVDRNGNPDGLRWNDGLPVLKRGPTPRGGELVQEGLML